MKLQRKVISSKTLIFPLGLAFTVPDPGGTAGRDAKPGVTDPAWIDIGSCKWSVANTSKTEEFMEGVAGPYVTTEETVLSLGLQLKTKLEKQSNLAYQLALAAAPQAGGNLPVSPTAGGQYNPLGGSPILQAWVHIQEYDQYRALINTVDYWMSIKASGDTNRDDKASETPIVATLLWSTLNSGILT